MDNIARLFINGALMAVMGISGRLFMSEASAEETLRPLKLDRASAYTLMIEVPCQPRCEDNVTWEYKLTETSSWTGISGTPHYAFNDTYELLDLQPDTLYDIRARLESPKRALLQPLDNATYTPELQARTCPAQPPPVTSLRVVDGGAGWLDVRWTPPDEKCKSRFYYMVRYGAEGSPLTESKKYGMYEHDIGNFLHLRPMHPCATWPREFCLLLTDSVQPGKNHTVEVQVVRLVSKSTSERSPWVQVYGLADVSNEVRGYANACPPAANSRMPVGTSTASAHSPNASVPLAANPMDWLAVLGWSLVVLLVVVMAVTWTVRRCRKKRAVTVPDRLNPDSQHSHVDSARWTSPQVANPSYNFADSTHVYDDVGSLRQQKPQWR